MENKKPANKLIIIFVTLLALCALIIAIIFFLKKPKDNSTSTVSHTNEVKQEYDNNTIQNETRTGTGNNTNTSSNIVNSISNTIGNVIDKKGEGNSTISENGNTNSGTLNANNNGDGQIGNGGSSSSSNGPGFVQDENGNYSANVEMEENQEINEIVAKNTNEYIPDNEEDDEDNSNKSNLKEYDNWNLTVKDNDYSNITVKLKLLNAPYNNDEYCEEMLAQNSFTIRLTSKPEGSICKGFPEKITINDNGKLNINTHTYTKTGNIDLSNTYFSHLGDYIFSIYSEDGKEELYQIIVTLRGITLEDGTPLWKTYSLIQMKSLLQNGEKVNNINLSIKNPNTAIEIDKNKNVNSFWEQVYVDVFIDSYENESYTVIDGNSLEKMGNHYAVRTEKGNIIPQTYKLANDGIIIIGRKSGTSVGNMLKIASINGFKNLKIAKNENTDIFEIPVGTKYKAEFSAEKQYRENYDMDGGGEFRVSKENVKDNLVKISNLTTKNPKTGVFYNIMPFAIVIVLAVIGIIVIKKLSVKNEKEEK